MIVAFMAEPGCPGRPINRACPCEVRAPTATWCGETAPNGYWICTRVKGHDGAHVTAGYDRIVARWMEE